MLATGIQGEKKEQVTQENTALTMKSGALKSICDTGNDRIDGACSLYKCCEES